MLSDCDLVITFKHQITTQAAQVTHNQYNTQGTLAFRYSILFMLEFAIAFFFFNFYFLPANQSTRNDFRFASLR